MTLDSAKLARCLARFGFFWLPRRIRITVERWIRGWQEVANLRRADVVVVSYSKSGRTWLRAMLAKFYQLKHGLPESTIFDLDRLARRNREIPRLVFTHDTYVADYDPSRSVFHGKKVVLLVRHPCDAAVSNYFQWKYRTKSSKTPLIGLPDPSDEMSLFDFVMTSTRGLPDILAFMNRWERQGGAMRELLVVRYEDMRARPEETLKRILGFFGTMFNEAQVAEAVSFASFENMQAMVRREDFRWTGSRLSPRDPDNADSHKVRRGKVGGWREYFDDRQIEAIQAYVDARLSGTFGYGGAVAAADAGAVSAERR